jgi:hypothetical protein
MSNSGAKRLIIKIFEKLESLLLSAWCVGLIKHRNMQASEIKEMKKVMQSV